MFVYINTCLGEWDRLWSEVRQNEEPRKGGGMANGHTGRGDRTEAPGNVNTERRGRGKGGQRNIKNNFSSS